MLYCGCAIIVHRTGKSDIIEIVLYVQGVLLKTSQISQNYLSFAKNVYL